MTKSEYETRLLELMSEATLDGEHCRLNEDINGMWYYMGKWDGLFSARASARKLYEEKIEEVEPIQIDKVGEDFVKSVMNGLAFAKNCLETSTDEDTKAYWTERVADWETMARRNKVFTVMED